MNRGEKKKIIKYLLQVITQIGMFRLVLQERK